MHILQFLLCSLTLFVEYQKNMQSIWYPIIQGSFNSCKATEANDNSCHSYGHCLQCYMGTLRHYLLPANLQHKTFAPVSFTSSLDGKKVGTSVFPFIQITNNTRHCIKCYNRDQLHVHTVSLLTVLRDISKCTTISFQRQYWK